MQVEEPGSQGPADSALEARAQVGLALVFGEAVRPLRMAEAVFDAALAGWARQQSARHLSEGTKRSGAALVRRFRAEVGLLAVGVAVAACR